MQVNRCLTNAGERALTSLKSVMNDVINSSRKGSVAAAGDDMPLRNTCLVCTPNFLGTCSVRPSSATAR